MLARYHQLPVSPEQLRHEYCVPGQPFGPQELMQAARAFSFRGRVTTPSVKRLPWLPLPVMVRDTDGQWMILARVGDHEKLWDSHRMGRLLGLK